MKKFIIGILFVLLAVSGAHATTHHYGCTSLTGGGTGALDALDITGASAPNAENLADNDSAAVYTLSGTTVGIQIYVFDADGTDAESSPDIIRPDDYSTQGVWRRIPLAELPSHFSDSSGDFQATDGAAFKDASGDPAITIGDGQIVGLPSGASLSVDASATITGMKFTDMPSLTQYYIIVGGSGDVPEATNTLTNIILGGFDTNKAIISDTNGELDESATTGTQIGYLSTLTGNAQTQMDNLSDAIDNEQFLPFTILNPADGDDPLVVKFPIAVTITQLDCVTLGGGSIDVDLQECDANGANCASGGIAVTTVSTTNVSDTSFTDASIDAGDRMKAVLTNDTGTLTQLECTVQWD